MKNRAIFVRLCAIICILTLSLSTAACNQRLDGDGQNKKTTVNVDGLITSVDTSINDKDTDSSYDENNSKSIVFSGSSASVSGLGASASGSDVTITGAGTYVVSGSSSNGSITVNAGNNKVQLVLAGLDLTNTDGPVIHVRDAKKVTITLEKGTSNILSDKSGYSLELDGSIIDGAIFSKVNLVINGEGSLKVNGNNIHGIVSKDELVIAGGTIEVKSTSTGICGKDCLKIADANITVNAGTDALKSDNELDADMGYIYIQSGTFTLNSVNDAIQSFNVATIEGGTFDITTTSTSSTLSAKAIKGGSGVHITGGSFYIDSEDDAIHSNGNVLIEHGSFVVSSSDDGIHADDTLNITGGNIEINKSYEGIEATNIVISGGYIDITSSDDGMNAAGGNDNNTSVGGRPGGDMFGGGTGTIVISGGYIIMHNEGDGVDSNATVEISGGVILVDGPQSGGNGSFDYGTGAKITGGVVVMLGTSDMAQNFSEATQGSILVTKSSNFAARTTLSLVDEDGNVIVAFTSTKQFRAALFSAPEIEKGKTYTFYYGATVEGLDENGYAHNTTQTGGTSCGSVTLTDYISGQGSGMPGGGRPR